MANRLYLVPTNAPSIGLFDPATMHQTDILSAASYFIPVFWFALFDETSLVDRVSRYGDGRPFSYPVLFDDSHVAVERASRRARLLGSVLPPAYESLYWTFLNLVSNDPHTHIWIDTREMWDLNTPDGFLALLKAALAAFASNPVEAGAPRDIWQPVFRQAGISDDASITKYKLVGGSWERPVPWEPPLMKNVYPSSAPTNPPSSPEPER